MVALLLVRYAHLVLPLVVQYHLLIVLLKVGRRRVLLLRVALDEHDPVSIAQDLVARRWPSCFQCGAAFP